MLDRPSHRRMLPVGNAKLFGCLLYDSGERRIVSVTHERAQVVDDVMIEPASEPTDERILCRIVSRCGENMINAILKFAAVRGKVGAVYRVRCLEYQRYAQTNDQMDHHERRRDEQRRFSQHHHRQNQHVGKVENLPCKEDEVLSLGMFDAPQVFVRGEEKALDVP